MESWEQMCPCAHSPEAVQGVVLQKSATHSGPSIPQSMLFLHVAALGCKTLV